MRILGCLLLVSAAYCAEKPKTKVEPVTETIHGVSVTDPYRWLEDQNSPETRAWIEEQSKYTDAALKAIPIREKIQTRLAELLKTERVFAPTERGGRFFYSKRAPDQDQSVIYMRKGLHGADQVLIDPNPMAADHTMSASLLGVSRDGSLLAYGIRQGGEDETTLSLMEVESRKTLADALPRARYGSVSILPDKSGFYYSKWSREGFRVFFHKVGGEAASDTLIFGEGYGPERLIFASLSEDGRYLMIVTILGSTGRNTEVFVQDLAGKGALKPVIRGIDARFSPRIGGDHLYVQTDWKAPNWRVLSIDLKHPEQDKWREIVPERAQRLDNVSLAGGKIALNYLQDVHSTIEIVDTDGKRVRTVPLPGLGTAGGPFGRWDSNLAVLTYVSFAQPQIIYLYDMETGKRDVWSETKAPFDPNSIEVEQVWYESKDKTRVPMFLVHKKGMPKDANRPVFLTGYGGFDVALTPQFSSTAVVWSEMGGIFALANLRGGGEFGEKWHRAGMFENKQNVFDDFVAAGEFLVSKGYTKPSRLSIEGGSNGGLLVGAALTQRPDLFQAVVCGAPLLDMVRYQMFKVARFWVSEYGSAENAEQFPYIYKYSPYHNVKPGVKYPAVMFVTGDADTRVDPLHARKMAALLQASTASDRPILLHYDTKAGHSAGLPVSRQVETTADELAFLAWQLGMEWK